jgi:uncharacterized Tic20 family protein
MTDLNPEPKSEPSAEPALPDDALPNSFAPTPEEPIPPTLPVEPEKPFVDGPPAAEVVIDAAWQPEAEPAPSVESTPGEPAADPAVPPSPPITPAGQPGAAPQPLSSQDERTWAMLSHLSILVNLFTGFLGPFVALVIYLFYRERSRYVAFHSLQSFVWQLAVWYGFGLLAVVLWILSVILLPLIGLGCLCMPLALAATLAPLAGLVYGLIAAIQTNAGQDFRYPWIGNWVQSMI